MKPRVTVIDYGLGNLHSVVKALAYVGAEVDLAADPTSLNRADRLVLPGVGAFADGMAGLRQRGLVEPLQARAASGIPLMGICLGAQLLLSVGEEFGIHQGLGIIPGRVVRLPLEGVKNPHVGWARLQPPAPRRWEGTPLADTPPGTWAYFIHSYHPQPEDSADICALAQYDRHPVTAAVGRGRITGFQFHPEKSGQAGLAMLSKFISD